MLSFHSQNRLNIDGSPQRLNIQSFCLIFKSKGAFASQPLSNQVNQHKISNVLITEA